jgi:hypothetical protein
MWGVGWIDPKKLPRAPERKSIKLIEEERRDKMCKTQVPSIPGRTARLKAIYLLQIAAEVEHALMVQYLYAAYSLDEAFGTGEGGESTRIVNAWKRDLRLIARQEMAHFVTVQNLLISLGAEVYVNRENNFSEHPDAYPFPVRFERFSRDSLARYVATEAPAMEEIKDPALKARLMNILKRADPKARKKINRVGMLYAVLYWLFLESDGAKSDWQIPPSIRACIDCNRVLRGVHIKNSDFVSFDEYREFSADRAEWGVYEDSVFVCDADPRSYALKAIQWIMLQGEGPIGPGCDDAESHFCKFLEIYGELDIHKSWGEAAKDVPLNPYVPDRHRTEPVATGAEAITHPETKLWAKLFNARYQMLLLDILLALSASKWHDAHLRTELTTWAASYEMEFLKQLGQMLTNMPRYRGSNKVRAGAPFESVQFPADNTKRWDQCKVLIEGSLELIGKLQTKMLPHDARFSLLQAIEKFDRRRKSFVNGRAAADSNYVWKEGNRRIKRRTL